MDPKDKEGVSGEDLQKSLDKLEEFATEGDQVSRKDELLAKAKEGELEKSERDELFALLGGGETTTDDTDSVGEDLVKSLQDGGEGLREALDVSPYLKGLHEGLEKALQTVGEHIEQSDKRQHEHALLQSRALVTMGSLIKSMSERLGVLESQPARGPKSKGVTGEQVMAKSFAVDTEGGGDGEDLTKSQIADALDNMFQEDMEKGGHGVSASGEDLALAISKFEQTSSITPRLHAEVKEFIGRRSAAH